MATYKVIQDIEAEDKLVGPLTLRQFIYAGISALCAYLSFVALSNGFPLALFVFGPPMLFTGFFAFPWGRDQPTEVWALAKLRFYLKSRRRIWNQSGIKDLVTITAPKHEVKRLTNNLSTTEVQSRLNALASTLDSRGWAIKNVSAIPPLVAPQDSDRLIDVSTIPRDVPQSEASAADDMLDSDNNPHARHVQEMVTAASTSHKQSLLEHMQHGDMPSLPAPVGQKAEEYWFTANPIAHNPAPTALPTSEAVLSNELHERHDLNADDNLKVIQPLPPAADASTPATPSVTATSAPDPATIHLSQRDDLNISTIARIAKGEDNSNEVVISLH